MTTILASRYGIAADSRTSWDDAYCTTNDKLEIIRGNVVGCAGHTPTIIKFLRWFRKPKGAEPDLDQDNEEKGFSAIVLGESGLFLYSNSCVPMPIRDSYIGIGSGGMAAKAAMLAGADLIMAVEIACKCDKNSGLPVQVITLEQALKG